MSESLYPVFLGKSDVIRRVQAPGSLEAAGIPTLPARASANDGQPAPAIASPSAREAKIPHGEGGALVAAPSASRRAERSRGFTIQIEGEGELSCTDVRGFREAALAALDPRAAAPQRLVLVAPAGELRAFLDAWAEDAEQVRRTLLIARRFDGRAVRAVVTIASHGFGVETSLVLESVSPPDDDGDHEIFRSGVYLKADLEAALARYEAAYLSLTEDDASAGPLELADVD